MSTNYFEVIPNVSFGEVYLTNYAFTISNLIKDFDTCSWDFGDGSVTYDQYSVQHVYSYPGTYTVKLIIWTKEGTVLTSTKEITVKYCYENNLIFSQIPSEYSMCGMSTEEPFILSLTAAAIEEEISISLQSFNSKSMPHYGIPDDNKWNFMIPSWKFVEANTNKTLSNPIKIETQPIYKDSVVVAVTGQLSFYYIDDGSTDIEHTSTHPVLIAAKLSSENFTHPAEFIKYPYNSYSNTQVTKAFITWNVNKIPVTNLKITENYVNEVFQTKWVNVDIPVTITPKFNRGEFLENTFYNCFSSVDVWEYPKSNQIGLDNQFKLILSAANTQTVDTTSYTVNNDHPEITDFVRFQHKDNDENIISGYINATITPLSASEYTLCIATSSTLSAAADTFGFQFPYGYPLPTSIYISNPNQSNINKIFYSLPSEDNLATYIERENIGDTVNITFLHTPSLTGSNFIAHEVPGTAAVYGLAVNPIHKKLYGLDADQDKLYMFNSSNMSLVSSVLLSSFTGKDYNTPSSISIDSEYNVWVSLWTNQALLKFDKELNYILSALPSITLPLSTTIEGNYLVAPPIVEADMNNNVWACYAHPISSMLVKFDSNGIELFKSNQLSFSSVPVALSINPQNDVWVANYGGNSVELYSTINGSLLSSLVGFMHPSYLAVDRDGNVCFTHGYNFCSVYNVTTSCLSTWKFEEDMSSFSTVSSYNAEDIALANHENEIWSGLAIDAYNRTWLINKQNNKVALIEDKENFSVKIIDISAGSGGTMNPIQAGGDWTGNTWFQKYISKFNYFPNKSVTSSLFNTYHILSSHQIAKVDEEFNYASYLKSLALPEILSRNTTFFDDFLGSVVGNGSLSNEEIGKTIYEKTANFVDNHSDIDTANVKHLASFAKEVAIPCENFNTSTFPVEITRLLDIFSIPKHNLRGYKNITLDEMDHIGPIIQYNSYINAGQYIYAKDKEYDTYHSIYVTPLSSNSGLLDTYVLSSLQVQGLKQPLTSNYYFFEYVSSEDGYTNNIINWDSEQTTITYNLSTEKEWYGDGGLVETMFNNLITKRLFFE